MWKWYLFFKEEKPVELKVLWIPEYWEILPEGWDPVDFMAWMYGSRWGYDDYEAFDDFKDAFNRLKEF